MFDRKCKAAQRFVVWTETQEQLELLVCVVRTAGKLVFFLCGHGNAGQLAMLYNKLLKLGGHQFNSFLSPNRSDPTLCRHLSSAVVKHPAVNA